MQLPQLAPEGGAPDAEVLGHLAHPALASPARANNRFPLRFSSAHNRVWDGEVSSRMRPSRTISGKSSHADGTVQTVVQRAFQRILEFAHVPWPG